jgi:hypothetical protein
MSTSPRRSRLGAARGAALTLLALAAAAPLALAAGTDGGGATTAATAKPAATTLAITTRDAGANRFAMKAPATIRGGLVKLVFTNKSKTPHEAQLVRLGGRHTAREALAILTAEPSAPIPAWLKVAGGAGSTGPGRATTTQLNVPAGRYAVLDIGGAGPSPSLAGAIATFRARAGRSGLLGAASATIVASDKTGATPQNRFTATGLKLGHNRLRFRNTGTQVHHALLFPILPGKTLDDVRQAFATQGPPTGPPPVDFAGSAGTAALDADGAEVTDLVLRSAGRYALVCFITNRDGKGRPHFLDGMLKEVEVR